MEELSKTNPTLKTTTAAICEDMFHAGMHPSADLS